MGCLVAVIALGLGLRLWALSWGLPLRYAHIDESVVLFYTLRIVAGVLNPGFYDYPGFFLYLLAGLLHGIHGVSRGLGALPPLDRLLEAYAAGETGFFILGARGLTVFFAVATLALLADMGRRRGAGGLGLGAAALLAVNPLHVLHSHYGTVDVAAAFLTLLALDRVAVFSDSGRLRDGLGAGAAVGLAAATKYFPGVLALFLLAIPFLRRHGRPGRTALLCGFAVVGGFTLGSPSTLAALPDFLSRLGHLFPKIVGRPGLSFPIGPTVWQLLLGVGPLTFLAGAAGVVLSLREKRGPWRGLLAGWGILFVFLGLWRLQPAHYGLALYPVFLLMACRGFAALSRFHRVLPAAAGAAAFFLSLSPTAGTLRMLAAPDTRLEAGAWIRGHIAQGSRILRFAHTPEFTAADPFRVKVDFTNQSLLWVAEGRDAPASLQNYDCLIYSSYAPAGDAALSALRERFYLSRSFERMKPRFPHHPAVFVFESHA